MSLKEIKKVNVSDEIYKQIINEIMKRNLKPGDKLPSEAELVETFGVSRVSVRAALQKLNGAGIIDSVNGGGSYVKNVEGSMLFGNILPMVVLQDYNITQLVDFRRGIEVVAAELAARTASEEEVAKLRAIYQDMERFEKAGKVKEYSEKDLEFHLQIASMSKNPFIMYVMEQMKEIIYQHVLELNQKYGPDNGMHYHERVLEMIEKHDQGKAREYMNLNLLNTQQETIEDD